jgi:hypothetical protein
MGAKYTILDWEKRGGLWMKKLWWCVPSSFSTESSEVVVYEPEIMYDQSLVKERDFAYGSDMHSQNDRLEEAKRA